MSRETRDRLIENVVHATELGNMANEIVRVACEITENFDARFKAKGMAEENRLEEAVDEGRKKIRALCRAYMKKRAAGFPHPRNPEPPDETA